MARKAPSPGGALPFGALRFLYLGSSDVSRDMAFYVAGGGLKLWQVEGEGTEVGAVRVGPGPVLLLADHRPPRTILPIFEVESLAASVRTLEAAGWTLHDPGFETPEGPCRVVRDPTGTELVVMQVTRPHAMA